jgi:hypothetical protein
LTPLVNDLIDAPMQENEVLSHPLHLVSNSLHTLNSFLEFTC